MADALEPPRQDMQRKAVDEAFRRQIHHLYFIVMRPIPPAAPSGSQAQQSSIANGGAVGVAAQNG